MKRITTFIVLFLALFAFAWTGLAQSGYDLSWFTVDGGGGKISGGDYTLDGTIGQPDAGALSSGPYTLVGGFWGDGAAVARRIYLPLVLRNA